MLSPIVLFVYNRLNHTKATVEALKNNYMAGESELIIFSDGPKSDEDKIKIGELRIYLKTIKGFKRVIIQEREKNCGLAESIIDGVTSVINQYGKVIVLEDDLVTSQHFLQFMNLGLDKYEKESKIISIHGYIYPVHDQLPEIFFLRGADCWGWATWKRGWDLFEKNGVKLLDQLKQRKLTKEFDFNSSYPYTRMLEDQILGKNNSWAIRWYASAFLNDKLTLYPGRSLVSNIGFDGTGTHCVKDNTYKIEISNSSVHMNDTILEENMVAKKVVENFFRSQRVAVYKKIICKLKKLLIN